ncbi:MAG: hypothetical protein ACRENS_05935 [Candidatus Eiseniibacteriota bacterium]
MQGPLAADLGAWENFYIIVGSSAGALTGLQFVVLTIISEVSERRGRKESIAAFGSPNIVHFCAALLVSAILSAPWSSLRQAGLAVALCGIAGLLYAALVLRRTLRQRAYRPVFEDWLWHNAMPTIAYASFLVAGGLLEAAPARALFAIGGALLLLVFLGIHNAWDTLTFLAIMRAGSGRKAPPADD